ncbi:MAG: PIN domain-containing protein, partial [Chitinophagaceae bacterium]|nr:PIN domain-containing protein [Chitinophagaceae bacterium]
MKYYCDTNFVIRYLLGDNQEMLLKTRKIFEQVQTGKIFLILEQTVFTEIVFILSSFYKVPRNKICEVLSELLAYKGIICEDKDSLLLALSLYHKQNLHIVDCVLIAKAEQNGLDILSFDQKLIKVSNKKGQV